MPATDAHGRPVIPSPAELKKLPPDGGPRWNRLVFEKSPYLLQHAANPVDWYPWGPEAFETARKRHVPVFLSVGYSTCHWCHVMEHESFEDAEAAAALNEAFVCVKVDREERPDIDHVYMAVTQAMTGRGGWPMTVVMTPDKKPFFAGTYFPKSGRHGRPGLLEIIPMLTDAWTRQHDQVVAEAQRITDAIAASQASSASPTDLGPETLAAAEQQLEARFDARWGGFGRSPKFPTPHQLSFLLRRHVATGDTHALAMVEKTLDEMRAGGIFDQVGFGFHRYSTDERWLVPHFEKMLYDQALIALAATECFAVTRDDRFARIARETHAYVLRDMVSPEGAFFSAEDADSEGEEGLFYVWTDAELRAILGAGAGPVARVFGVTPEGNFRDEATGARTGANILHLPEDLATAAQALDLSEADLAAKVESARQKLFDVREKRVHPLKDDKVLTDWNGLMIASLAVSARVFGDAPLEAAARRAADAVLDRLVTPEGRCLKRMRHGEAGLPGMLDDHAFLAWGLVELYETTFDARYLDRALAIVAAMEKHFADPAGGYFLAPDDGEALPVRGRDAYDGATPSGNSVAAYVLVRLARLTGDVAFEDRAEKLMAAFSGDIRRGPSAYSFMMMALELAAGASRELVIVGDPLQDDTRALIAEARSTFRPDLAVIVVPPSGQSRITEIAPFTAAMRARDGQATAYACTNRACKAPVTTPADLRSALAPPAR